MKSNPQSGGQHGPAKLCYEIARENAALAEAAALPSLKKFHALREDRE
jgi:hypothetical protein